MREVDLRTTYKYLAILKANGIMDKAMKCNFTNEYYRRIQKILKSLLNGLNCNTATNFRTVPIVRCRKTEMAEGMNFRIWTERLESC